MLPSTGARRLREKDRLLLLPPGWRQCRDQHVLFDAALELGMIGRVLHAEGVYVLNRSCAGDLYCCQGIFEPKCLNRSS
jgi:hypothetical protein